jgi:hypothetical protein
MDLSGPGIDVKLKERIAHFQYSSKEFPESTPTKIYPDLCIFV